MKKAFFVAACMLSITLSAQVITSNFNTDADGWQKRDAPAGGLAGAIYQTTGGNPGGHISAKDILPVSTMYFVAPPKFLGNKSWAYNNTLTFDLKIETGTFFSEDDVIIEGNGVILVLDFANPTTSWTTFTCTLNENSGWRVGTRNGAVATKADILNVLCNVTRIWIRAEFFSNFLQFDEGYLDNVNLTVTPCFSTLNRKDTICVGKSVVLNGKTYNATGIYTDTIRRCYPLCDSVINLNLTVVNAFRSTQNPTICSGNTFKVGTKTYNQTGIYTDILKSIGGCDSIITTNLTVSPPLSISRDTSICDTYSIKVGTKTYNRTGIYRDTLQTSRGCDSIVITNLTVNKSYTTGQNVSICPSGSYTIGTHTYTQAGVYQDILKTINGCDSIVTTTLIIEAASSRTQKVNLCTGQTLPVGTHIYTQTGIYRDTFRTAQGCDSIVISNLTINPVYLKNQDTTICSGNSLKIGNKTYNKTGIYRDTLQTIAGCDSIINTNLKILPPLSISRDSSICEGNFIKIGNKTYNQTGVYRDTLQTNKGCDSIVITNLMVNKTYDMPPQNVAICPNSVYKIGVHNYTQAGIYRDTFRTIKGCDSIITTVLSVYPVLSKNKDTTICQGNSIKIGIKTYNQTGIYRDTFKTINNCDSILITNLIVNPIYLKNQDTSICSGNSLKVGTKTYNKTGIYRDTLQTISGCDSIINTNLKILPPLSISRDSSICEGNFIKVGNKTYNQTGIYRDTLQTNKGCDSIVIMNLTVNKRYTMPPQNVAICPTGSYTIGTHTYTQAGVYKDTLRTVKGCDSIITTTLSIQNVFLQTQNKKLCAGESVRINNHVYTQTGIYRDTFRTLQGCDSIIITDLMINPVYLKNQDTSICSGNSFKVGTKIYAKTGIYRDTLQTILGCDSIILTNLKMLPPLSISRDSSICEGNFIKVGNKTYNQTGIYRDTLQTNKGCDSIVITNLTVNKRYTMPTQNVAICPNSFYKIGVHTYTQVGIYRDTLMTSKGCDSIVTTNLSFNSVYSENNITTICYGYFIKVGNKIHNTTGIYRDTLQTIKGCDSIIITNLTVKPERKRIIDTTICEGKSLIINYKTYKVAGTYGDTMLTNAQCDSILVISLKVKPLPIIKKTAVLCANDSAVINGRVFTKIGIFRDTIISPTNCNEIIEWTVQKSPLQLSMGISPLIELGDSIRLTPSVSGASNVLWTWQSNKALSCLNCPNPFAKPLITTLFTLIVKDTTTNCSVQDAIKVTIKPCENIFMPTAFSPNNDGENDYFSVFASGCVRKVNKMRLFNRWGIMVFSKDNFLPNDEKNGWDGKMNNTLLPSDVYIYVIELELGNGKTKLFSGDVTLIR